MLKSQKESLDIGTQYHRTWLNVRPVISKRTLVNLLPAWLTHRGIKERKKPRNERERKQRKEHAANQKRKEKTERVIETLPLLSPYVLYLVTNPDQQFYKSATSCD
jgi:hypothetical protein